MSRLLSWSSAADSPQRHQRRRSCARLHRQVTPTRIFLPHTLTFSADTSCTKSQAHRLSKDCKHPTHFPHPHPYPSPVATQTVLSVAQIALSLLWTTTFRKYPPPPTPHSMPAPHSMPELTLLPPLTLPACPPVAPSHAKISQPYKPSSQNPILEHNVPLSKTMSRNSVSLISE